MCASPPPRRDECVCVITDSVSNYVCYHIIKIWWRLIKIDWLFSLLPIYFFHPRGLLPPQSYHSLSSIAEFSCPEPLRVQRDRGSMASETRRLSGVQAIRFLESVFRDCSLYLFPWIAFFLVDTFAGSDPPSSWWTCLRDRNIFFLVDIRGTTLRTSFCIDSGPLFQATHYVD